MKTFIDTINFGVKNWWVSLLLGLLYILIAICLMFTPLASYVALSVLFSVCLSAAHWKFFLPSPIKRIFPVGAGIWQAVSST